MGLPFGRSWPNGTPIGHFNIHFTHRASTHRVYRHSVVRDHLFYICEIFSVPRLGANPGQRGGILRGNNPGPLSPGPLFPGRMPARTGGIRYPRGMTYGENILGISMSLIANRYMVSNDISYIVLTRIRTLSARGYHPMRLTRDATTKGYSSVDFMDSLSTIVSGSSHLDVLARKGSQPLEGIVCSCSVQQALATVVW